MLVLARRVGETIVIDGGIEVTILDIRGRQVKMGFDAPRDVNIIRKEVLPITKGASDEDSETVGA